ncbi:MAG: hypothetical protein C0600_09620, partial [Ignavibacteria bacterium]
NDVTAPVVTVPAPALSMECYDASVVQTWADLATALDNCDGSVAVSASWTPPPNNCNQTVTVTFTAVDNCGNTGTATKDFLVNDVTAPVVTVPVTALSMQCYDAAVVQAWANTATALDNCDGAVSVSANWTAPPDNCIRTVTVTFTAVDNCGNTGTATKDFIVNDNTAPVITVPSAALTMECYDASAVQTWASNATALDNCDGSVSVSANWTPPPDNCNQTVTVTFTAVDNCGNIGTATKDFLVDDNTPPVITVPSTSPTMECYDAAAVRTWADMATALDNCDGSVVVTPTWTAPPDNCNRTVTVTFTAVDNCMNVGTATKTFLVNDITPPVISGVPVDANAECDAVPAPPGPGVVTATDNCDPNPSLSMSETNTKDPNAAHCGHYSYQITRTWTATDACNNTSSDAQVITVNDTQPPIWLKSPPANVVVDCATDPIPFWDPQYGTDYDDNCDPNPTLDLVVIHDIIPQPDGTKHHIRTWKIVDACNNESVTQTQIIIESRCQFASLTQGFYGNIGGVYCGNGMTAPQLLPYLIPIANDLVVGDPPNTGSLTITNATAVCILGYLPGGGTASVLTHNYQFNNPPRCNITPNTMPLGAGGRFRNILLSQTITLALNMRLDLTIGGGVKLPPPTLPYMWTYASDYVNGVCLDGNDVETGLPQPFYIPPAVMTAIGSNGSNKDLNDLLAFANAALGGASTSPATLTEVSTALDAYNKGFDNARFFAGYHAAPPPKTVVPVTAPKDFALDQNHPNPFNPITTISFTIPVECEVYLSIFNGLGEEIAVLVDRMVPAGTHAVSWNIGNMNIELPSGVYTYRIHAKGVDDREFHNVKKMMLVK